MAIAGITGWAGGKSCWTEVIGARSLKASGLIHLDFDVSKTVMGLGVERKTESLLLKLSKKEMVIR